MKTADDHLSELMELVRKSSRPTQAILRQSGVSSKCFYDWSAKRNNCTLNNYLRVLDAMGYELTITRKPIPQGKAFR